VALLAGALLLAAVEAGAKDDFPVPTALAPAVRFWVDMFTRYGQQDVVLHDRYEFGRVYEVVHLDGADSAGEVATRVQAISDRFRSPVVLARAAGDPLFVEPPDVVRDADRVRAQRGMREDVVAALASARLYGPVVERALAHEGLPPELNALPLFESSYHPEAVSSGGAVGLWQLTRATAQQYLRVDDEVDERRDPERASAAAAAHLRELRGALPNWPLAITAYNHGLGGVTRARRQIGSDNLGEVVMNYSGPGFGFASRNYYAEFRAALEVMRHADRYFPELSTARVIEVRVKPGDTLATLARRHGVSVPSIRAANGLNSTLLQPGRLLLVRL
jgi:membrane-bound lytic murein transglycosylase D